MIETIAILGGLGIHYLLLDRRLTKVERDMYWVRKYIKIRSRKYKKKRSKKKVYKEAIKKDD